MKIIVRIEAIGIRKLERQQLLENIEDAIRKAVPHVGGRTNIDIECSINGTYCDGRTPDEKFGTFKMKTIYEMPILEAS